MLLSKKNENKLIYEKVIIKGLFGDETKGWNDEEQTHSVYALHILLDNTKPVHI